MLAVGLEVGEILIFTSSEDTPSQWTKALTIGTECVPAVFAPKPQDADALFSLAHIDHIHRLAWRPGEGNAHQLASCSEDGTLKLLTVRIATEQPRNM